MKVYLNPRHYPELASFSEEEKSLIVKDVYASKHLGTWQAGLTAFFATFAMLLSSRFFSSFFSDGMSDFVFAILIICFLMIGIIIASIIYFIGVNTIVRRLVQHHIDGLKNVE